MIDQIAPNSPSDAGALIFLDTNVISETLRPRPARQLIEWLTHHDATVAFPRVILAELAYAIERIRPDERASRLDRGLKAWRHRFRDRIFAFREDDAMAYGRLMGRSAQTGRTMSVPDGMIAAMALNRGWALASRNVSDFSHLEIEVINPFGS